MRTNFAIGVLLLSSLVAVSPASTAADLSPLVSQSPIQVSEKPQRFDLLSVDVQRHRLLAAHAQAGALTIVDTGSGKLRWDDPLGEHTSGVAVDSDDDRYFLSLDQGVVVIDSNTTRKTLYIDTPGPTDAIIYDHGTNKIYVGHDDGTELWVIKGKVENLVGHIDLPGIPELMDVDSDAHRLYVNIKDKDEVAVIDTTTDKIVATWPTPATHSPHGLVLDIHGGRVFVAGQSNNISVFSLGGKMLGTIDIGPGRVDQIAYDEGNKHLYVPSSGRLVAIDMSANGSVLGSVEVPQGTHSVTVDPSSHFVWIAYADKDHAYVQAFAPNVVTAH